jgi:methionyl-tRNA formyltransferase
LRLLFAGTPAFAATALQALIDAGHEVVLVLTQPDRPAGRGLKLVASDVKILAQKHILTVEQPLTLKTDAARDLIAAAVNNGAEAMIVAAYGLILPPAILALPRLGCLNIHASLLPRWRGAAPIQRAILAGDAETGITIMQMDAGLDTGAMLARRAIPIGETETAGELHDRLAALGGEMIVETLRSLPSPVAQDAVRATYAAKLTKEEALIDWEESAIEISRRVRAYNPFPGAAATLNGERIKLWRAAVTDHQPLEPGTVCNSAPGELIIACGQGALKVLELQRAGGKRLPTATLLKGFPIPRGACFSTPGGEPPA